MVGAALTSFPCTAVQRRFMRAQLKEFQLQAMGFTLGAPMVQRRLWLVEAMVQLVLRRLVKTRLAPADDGFVPLDACTLDASTVLAALAL